MTDGIDIKRPRRLKKDGEPAAPKAPVKKAGVVGRSPGIDSGAVPRPRPTAKAAPPRPRPTVRATPVSDKPQVREPQAAALRPPRTGRPVRREKNLEGLGRLLKTKREIHGLTRRDVVVKIKIPLDQLEAIEEGRLSSLPPVFAKGFLRAYANELGLDAEAILEDYRQLTGGFKNEPASREPLAPRYVETSVGKVGGGMGPLAKMAIIGLILVCLIGGLAVWLWPGLSGRLSSSLPFANKIPGLGETEAGRGNSITIPAGTPTDENRQTTDSSIPVDGPEDTIFVEDPILNQGGGVGGAISTNTPAPVPAGGTLILTSRMDKVWVDVLVDGERQFLWMRNGQEITWHARRSITITSGQPNALSARWNGQEINPLSPDPVSVIQVTFPKEG